VEEEARYCAYSNRYSLPTDDPWENKEERRTISGYIEADTYVPGDVYDPICDNCYNLFEAIIKPAQYHPRFGHGGYRSARSLQKEKQKRAELLQFYKTLAFHLVWPKRYVIS
jgi:hypothetical protein